VLSALVRRRAAGLIHGFSNLSYEERLKNRTNDPGNKKISGNLMEVFETLKGSENTDRDLFSIFLSPVSVVIR